MTFTQINGVAIHYDWRAGSGMPVVFLNSLGTDFRIWDGVVAQIGDAPILRMDKQGHGLSGLAPLDMDRLVADAAALMDQLNIGPAVICGVSVGGMIAQGLAISRPDLVAGLVLCCTGATIGTDEIWNERIEATMTGGLEPMGDAVMQRWFSPDFHAQRAVEMAGYRNMLVRTPAPGYAAVSAAIRDADFTQGVAGITVPTICVAGEEDNATPPALVRTLSGLITGSTLHVIPAVGHLPGVEVPEEVARHVTAMRAQVGAA